MKTRGCGLMAFGIVVLGLTIPAHAHVLMTHVANGDSVSWRDILQLQFVVPVAMGIALLIGGIVARVRTPSRSSTPGNNSPG